MKQAYQDGVQWLSAIPTWWTHGLGLADRIRVAKYRMGYIARRDGAGGVLFWVVELREGDGPRHYFPTEREAGAFLQLCTV
jgi:hypothetical protein